MVLEHYSKESTTTQDRSNVASAQSKRSTASSGKENITQGLQLGKASKISSGSIESNFQKAMIAQNCEFSEVEEFLADIKMEKYKDVFIENGIEDRETILELNESHLQELGLPLGHKLKIMKKIKDLNKKSGDKRHEDPVSSTQNPKMASSATATVSNNNNLLDGQYDEEQNRKEFQEALLAWRKGGANQDQNNEESDSTPASSKQKSKKSVRFADNPPEEFLILGDNPEDEEAKEDNVATVMSSKLKNKPTTEIKEGMIAFKGLSLSTKSFLFSEEASGSSFWNPMLLSTVDHAGTSPRNSESSVAQSVEPEDKELCHQCYKYKPKSEIEKDGLTQKSF